LQIAKPFIFFLLLFFGSSIFAQTSKELDELNILDSIAFVALETNNSDVVEKANKLLSAGIEFDSPVHQINALTILGIVNKNKGYNVTAVDYYNKALQVAKESNDQGRISACYNNIGSVYQIQENYDKALYYFKASLAIEDELNNPIQKSIRLYNLGEIYREMDSLSLALSHFNNSLLIEKEYSNNEGIVYALLGIAEIYLELEKLADADISLDEVRSYLDKSDIETQVLYNLLHARLLKYEGSYNEALLILKDSKSLCKQHEFKVHLMEIYEEELAIKELQDEQSISSSESTSRNGVYFGLLAITVLLITALFFVLTKRRRNKNVVLKNDSSSSENSVEVNQIFKLDNNKGKTLIEIELGKILCFESNDNYVIIYYLSNENGLLRTMERSSLKKIEEVLTGMDVLFHRVHKSYIVNPTHIKKITGKAQAYKLEIACLDFVVPVSRSFDIGKITG
jgi:tetratricopeptide (TPR) repeat protein